MTTLRQYIEYPEDLRVAAGPFLQGRSSMARALVSGTRGWRFESSRPCQIQVSEEASHGVGCGQVAGPRFSHRRQGLGVRIAALEAGCGVMGDDVIEHFLQRIVQRVPFTCSG